MNHGICWWALTVRWASCLHITHKHVLNEFPEKQCSLLLNESDESWCCGHREEQIVWLCAVNKAGIIVLSAGWWSCWLSVDRAVGQWFRDVGVMLLTSHLRLNGFQFHAWLKVFKVYLYIYVNQFCQCLQEHVNVIDKLYLLGSIIKINNLIF